MILGLDTATAATAVAAVRADGEAFERRDDPAPGARPGHSGRLLELVEGVIADAGCAWADVERIAVGVGPGGFTGLRIGIATARGLAQANGIPIVGVSSLRALAAPALGADPGAPVLAVIDARRGEAFAAAFDPAGAPLAGAAALAPEALAELAATLPGGALAVGDGAVKFRAELERSGASVPPDDSRLHRIGARHVCRLGAAVQPGDRDALVPDYRREPDAKPRTP